MASITKCKAGYRVRWRDPDRTQRSRTVRSRAAAEALKREIEDTTDRGRRWAPRDADPVPLFVGVDTDNQPIGAAADFIAAHTGIFSKGTIRHYNRALLRFAAHLKRENPRQRRLTLDLLSKDVLERWWTYLRSEHGDDLAIGTARLYVGAVISAWEWAYDSDAYGDRTPRPRRIRMPTPEITPAKAPSWAHMDAVIHEAMKRRDDPNAWPRIRKAWAWRVRFLWLLRFTGLRMQQVMRLTWDDIDLEAQELLVTGRLGKSSSERRGRWVPLAPALAEEMATWGRREGYVVAPDNAKRHSHPSFIRELWEAAGVPRRIWAPPPGAKQGWTQHAFRKGFKSGLADLGVDSEVRDFLVGHHRGVNMHYEDLQRPARRGVALIPPVSEPGAEVVELDEHRTQENGVLRP